MYYSRSLVSCPLTNGRLQRKKRKKRRGRNHKQTIARMNLYCQLAAIRCTRHTMTHVHTPHATRRTPRATRRAPHAATRTVGVRVSAYGTSVASRHAGDTDSGNLDS